MSDSRAILSEEEVDQVIATDKKTKVWNWVKGFGQESVAALGEFLFAEATFLPTVPAAYGLPGNAINFCGEWNSYLKNAPTFAAVSLMDRATGVNTGVENLSWFKAGLARSVTAVCSVGVAIGADQFFEYLNLYSQEERARAAEKATVAVVASKIGRGVEAAVLACAWKKDTKKVSLSSVPGIVLASPRTQPEGERPLLEADHLELGQQPKL